MSTVESQFDPFGLSPSQEPGGKDMLMRHLDVSMKLSTEEILALMEKDEKLAKLAISFRATQSASDLCESDTSGLDVLSTFSSIASLGRAATYPPTLSPTIASLGAPSPFVFPAAMNPFLTSPSTSTASTDSSTTPPGLSPSPLLFKSTSGDSSYSSSSDSSPSHSPTKALLKPSASPNKSYTAVAQMPVVRKSMKNVFSAPANSYLQTAAVPPKSTYGPVPVQAPLNGNATTQVTTDKTSHLDGIFSRGALPRSSRTIAIGKDYLDQENKDVECGMANGLCVMTHPNVPFETSLSQFLPLVSEVAELLLADLKEIGASQSFGKKNMAVTSPSAPKFVKNPISRFGAVCRNERSRVHYYVHVYDPVLPVHKLFERLMLHPSTSKLESISRIYPVTAAAHPEVDYAETCIRLISSHPLTLKISNAASSSANGGGVVTSAHAPGSKVTGARAASNGTLTSSGASSAKSPTLTIGLALESHRASDFAKELSAAIVSSLPFIEIVERNPMHCDLMLSSCYFNTVFMTTLWEPINTNDLNNYRPQEMLTWSILHPSHPPRTAFVTQPQTHEYEAPITQKSNKSPNGPFHPSTHTPFQTAPPKAPLLKTESANAALQNANLINTASLDLFSFKQRSARSSTPTTSGYISPPYDTKSKNKKKNRQ